MGIDRTDIPDALLKRVDPKDRKRLNLPSPLAEIVIQASAKSDAKREKELQWSIVSWLRLRGYTVLWSRTDRKFTGTVGWPDITLAVKGKATALECKLPGQKPNEDQVRVMAGLVRDGWAVKIIYSLDEARTFVASLL
jgi:hypothetical protein